MVGGSWLPIVLELVLCTSAPKPIVAHVHCLGASWVDVVCDTTKCCAVLGLDGRRRLLCPISSSRLLVALTKCIEHKIRQKLF
jgi:hypothetical protein